MCGLWGYAATQNVKNLSSAALVIALENQSRGRDSWGVSNGQQIIRSVGEIHNQWHKIPFRNRGLLMGHTRAATVGGIKEANSHPFEFKDKFHVIGAHNGHVSNWQELNAQYERTLEVDSMHIFAHIASGLPLNEVHGSGAVVFLKDNSLYFSRFNNGSLAIAQLLSDDDKPMGLAWSSLSFDLKKGLYGAGIKFKMYDVENGHIYFWGDDKLYDTKNEMPILHYVKVTASTNTEINYRNKKWNYQTNKWEDVNTKSYSARSQEKRIIRFRVVRQIGAAQ